jgi:hypothetical protein
MWGTSEVAQEILTSEDLLYVVLVGWLFIIRTGFEWLKTGHVSCCETCNEVSVSLKKLLHKMGISIILYVSIY